MAQTSIGTAQRLLRHRKTKGLRTRPGGRRPQKKYRGQGRV